MEVVNRAGRPGMAIGCVETSPTALAQLSAASWGGFRPSDWHHVATVSEFKTNYDLLSKVAHITRIGGVMECYYNPIFGGYAGGAEGVAGAIANAELTFDLWATSVVIRRGHRIRVAIAGADKDTFLRYPRDGSVPTVTVERNQVHASRIRLPMR